MFIFATISGTSSFLRSCWTRLKRLSCPAVCGGNFVLRFGSTAIPGSRGTKSRALSSRRAGAKIFLATSGRCRCFSCLRFGPAGLIFGFALLQYGAGEHVMIGNEPVTFGRVIYLSGSTFFTLGYGDIIPTSELARTLAVLESGMGFGFLGVVIGYLPTIYSSFSRREIQISMLDARAGSPPTAAEMLIRLGNCAHLDDIFREWEHWAAELLESHISYPPLGFFRSQHINQSWLGALTMMLDTTAMVSAGIDGIAKEQAKLTLR